MNTSLRTQILAAMTAALGASAGCASSNTPPPEPATSQPMAAQASGSASSPGAPNVTNSGSASGQSAHCGAAMGPHEGSCGSMPGMGGDAGR